jgi:hypothetical protein
MRTGGWSGVGGRGGGDCRVAASMSAAGSTMPIVRSIDRSIDRPATVGPLNKPCGRGPFLFLPVLLSPEK